MATTTDTLIFELKVKDEASKTFDAWDKRLKKTAKESTSMLNSSMNAIQTGVSAFSDYIGRNALGAIQNFVTGSVDAFGEFEQGMAGIAKTVDATEEELERLGDSIREAVITDLRGTTTVSQLQEIAQMGGKFGILIDDLGSFSVSTAKMAKLWDISVSKTGEATARLIAQYDDLKSNQIEHIGSVVDFVADSAATSEKFIIDFAQRVSGVANNTGQSLAEISATAASIAVSTGMRAQAAATAYRAIMDKMSTDIDGFARFMGESTENWVRLITKDGDEAFNLLLGQLDKLKEQQGVKAYNDTIKELFGSGTRLKQLLDGMTGTQDQNRESILRAVEAFEEGTRVSENFAKSINTQKAAFSELKAVGNEIMTMFGEQFGMSLETAMPLILSTTASIRDTINALFAPEFWDEIVQNTGSVFRELGLLMLDNFVGVFKKGWQIVKNEFLAELQEWKQELTAFWDSIAPKEATEETIKQQEKLNETLSQYARTAGSVAKETNESTAAFGRMRKSVEDVDYAVEGGSLTPALERLQWQMNASKKETDNLNNSMDESTALIKAQEQEIENLTENNLVEYKESLWEVEDAIKEHSNLIEDAWGPERIMHQERLDWLEKTRSELVGQQNAAKNRIDSLRDWMGEEKELLSSTREEYRESMKVFEERQSKLGNIFDGLSNQAQEWLFSQRDMSKALKEVGIQYDNLTASMLQKMKTEFQENALIKEKISSLEQLSGATQKAISDTVQLSESTGSLGKSMEGFVTTIQTPEEAKARREYREYLQRLGAFKTGNITSGEQERLRNRLTFEEFRGQQQPNVSSPSTSPVQQQQQTVINNNFNMHAQYADQSAFNEFVRKITQTQKKEAKLRV
jgi:TP901 family phage tail tape measure protein